MAIGKFHFSKMTDDYFHEVLRSFKILGLKLIAGGSMGFGQAGVTVEGDEAVIKAVRLFLDTDLVTPMSSAWPDTSSPAVEEPWTVDYECGRCGTPLVGTRCAGCDAVSCETP